MRNLIIYKWRSDPNLSSHRIVDRYNSGEINEQ